MAALLALASSVALGADASSATAAGAQLTATAVRFAEVEGLTVRGPHAVESSPSRLGALVRAAFPDESGWRSGWFPRLAVDPVALAATVAPAPRQTTAAPPSAPTVWWQLYHGTNHVWMPTLGISKPVYLFPCSRTTDPANLVYRWGCAGTNNLYLLGHAYGVFKALHDAYDNGKLRKGLPVVYANGAGRTRLYRVVSWRAVAPTDSAWAIASQSQPSMTLQTCVGPNLSLRLVVRLVAVDR